MWRVVTSVSQMLRFQGKLTVGRRKYCSRSRLNGHGQKMVGELLGLHLFHSIGSAPEVKDGH